MSNGGWQPPQPGPTPPPGGPPPGPAGPPPGPGFAAPGGPPPGPNDPTHQTVALQPAPAGPSRSKAKVIAAGVGVVALIGAGVFAVTRISADGASGGAASPEEAGLSLLGALENEDMLGMIDVLLPGERETLRGPASDMADEMRRLEVLSDDASLSEIGGVDIEFDDESVEVTETAVDDIVNLRISAGGTAAIEGSDLPIGDLVLDNVDADPADLDVPEEPTDDLSFSMTAVQEDGRWYLSLFHTAAEAARTSADMSDIPDEGVVPAGGDSPEDAFDALIGGIEALDLEVIIASLNPDEFQALQRYAPLFLDDAQTELDRAGVEFSIDEPEYSVSGSGDTRSVAITYIAGEISAEGETVSFELEGGCFTLTPPEGEGDPVNTCELLDQAPSLDDMFGESAGTVEDFLATLESAFSDYENPGFIVKQVDGQWFVSPMATGAEQMLAFIRALDREEIESIAEAGQELAEEVIGDVLGPGGPSFPDEFVDDEFPTGEVDDPVTVDTLPEETDADIDPDAEVDDTSPDFTIPDFTVPDGSETDPDLTTPDGSLPDDLEEGFGDECIAATTAEDAVDCYQALVDSGDISPSAVPVYLQAPECGLAELYWSGDYYSLPDAEFISVVEEASPCFQELVAAGTLGEFDLPLELGFIDCLEGRNWYAAYDDDEYFDRLLDCAYG